MKSFDAILEKIITSNEENLESEEEIRSFKCLKKWIIQGESVTDAKKIAMKEAEAATGHSSIRFYEDLKPIRFKSHVFVARAILPLSIEQYRIKLLDLDVRGSDFIDALESGSLRYETYEPGFYTHDRIIGRIKSCLSEDENNKSMCKDCRQREETSPFTWHVHHNGGIENRVYYETLLHDEDFIREYYSVMCAYCHALHHEKPDPLVFDGKMQISNQRQEEERNIDRFIISREIMDHVFDKIGWYKSLKRTDGQICYLKWLQKTLEEIYAREKEIVFKHLTLSQPPSTEQIHPIALWIQQNHLSHCTVEDITSHFEFFGVVDGKLPHAFCDYGLWKRLQREIHGDWCAQKPLEVDGCKILRATELRTVR